VTGGLATALVVDDEQMVRHLVRRVLEPGVDGFDLVHVLADNCPDLPVACMSGFANLAGVGNGVTVPFVSKPFTVETLVEAIGSLLARSREIRQHAGLTRDRAARGRADGPSKG
jgi:FixJ family two-component response regulator